MPDRADHNAAIAVITIAGIRTKAKALDRSEQVKLKGWGQTLDPPHADCSADAKTAEKIAVAAARLVDQVQERCGGVGGQSELGWPSACPKLRVWILYHRYRRDDACRRRRLSRVRGDGGGRAGGITRYDGSLGEQADGSPCALTIGKEAVKFLLAKEKRCASAVTCAPREAHGGLRPDHLADPATGQPAMKAAEQIAKAEAKKITKICQVCGGLDRTCDDPVTPINPLTPTIGGNGGGGFIDDDLEPAPLLANLGCPNVTVPAGPSRTTRRRTPRGPSGPRGVRVESSVTSACGCAGRMEAVFVLAGDSRPHVTVIR